MDKTNLKRQLTKLRENLKNLKFPSYTAGNEQLGELLPELADLDGYMAGLVSSYLSGDDISKWNIQVDENMNKKLKSIIPKNKEEELAIQNITGYKIQLDRIASILIELTGTK